MDDIMILMNKVIIDILGGFDDTQFGIFDDDEQDPLHKIWHKVNCEVMKFINILSPAQKQRVAIWAANRTEYTVDELVKALKKFTKFLESASYANYIVYPKPKRVKNTTIFRKKKNIQ